MKTHRTGTRFLTRVAWAALLPLLLVCSNAIPVSGESETDLFESAIRPVLAETCFPCHGDVKSGAELRVDSREALLKGGDSGPAIVPGRSAESLLVQAIQRHEGVSAMPPDKERTLRPDQVAAFVAWVDRGASWPAETTKFEAHRHWAFEPIQEDAKPVVLDHDWVKTSIDAFIRAKQEAVGISPSAPAKKVDLIRRATFDLTGLPPTPEEIAAFVNDSSPIAFEVVVDRLLKSSAYGERWGRHWLDVVRYADTAGETADFPVPSAWRYRNYVIDAFNADKPYDEFLREQIAGDVIANQGPSDQFAERVIATGFLAISRRFGFDSENYHHLTIQDTIDTLGQTVLGLSIGCARCHDHKFDPLTLSDYYGLYGIFDSSRYSFPGSEQKQRLRVLSPLLPPHESIPKWHEFEKRVAAITSFLQDQKQPVETSILRSLDDLDGDFELQAPAAGGSQGTLVSPWLSDGPIALTNAAQSPFQNLHPRGRLGVSISGGAGEYRMIQSLHPQRFGLHCEKLYVNLDFRMSSPAPGATESHRFWIGTASAESSAIEDPVATHVPLAKQLVVIPSAELLVSAETVTLKIGDYRHDLGPSRIDQWCCFQLDLDLKNQIASGHVGVPGDLVEFSGIPLSLEGRDSIDMVGFDSATSTGTPRPAIEFDNLGVQETPIGPVRTELAAKSSTETGPDTTGQEINVIIERSKEEINQLLADGPFTMTYGMAEGTPHNVNIQIRGEPTQLGSEVPRGFVKVLGGGPLSTREAGSGRLELAQWLTRTDNPLTARVMVNRIWQHHFGRGLVKTPNDFGVRGIPPTHPELLDHLAHEFVQSGWSIKSMHRKIMLSATYQQSVAMDSKVLTTDTTDFYTAFLRRRLSAEEIRDSILMVSGDLDKTPAQAHPFPSAVNWSFSQHAPFNAVYDHDKRSVYLMTQRLKRHPFLALFDGADPNATTAQRLGTTVPTQALFFLNDPFVHRKSEQFAKRLLASSPSETERIVLAHLMTIGRPPTDAEQVEATSFLLSYREQLVAENRPQPEIEAIAAYVRTLFGCNEFLHVD